MNRRWVDGIRIGRFAGIPIIVAPSWLLSILVIMYIGAPVVVEAVPGTSEGRSYLIAALLGVLLGLSVLLHELGHCIAAMRLKVPVHSVRLYLLGGVSEVGRSPRSPGEEAQIAAAGPVVSVVLAAAATGLATLTEPHTLRWLLLVQLALANGLIALFNLIPALPLDGGRVLRAGVWRLWGRRGAGTTAAVVGGYLVALGLLVWGGFLLAGGTKVAVLQATIAFAMALFIGVGAFGERAVRSSPGRAFAIADFAHPCVEVPSATPVAQALRLSAGAEVALAGEHGNIIGVLDREAAESLQLTSPGAPAFAASHPIGPEQVILFSDTAQEVMEVVRASGSEYFLLIGSEGQAAGVLRRTDLGRSG
ncbi:site-2 protease family protein [Nakamurella silvestris]|nr:site-2 protease family protein [Nakamurella silvestris]